MMPKWSQYVKKRFKIRAKIELKIDEKSKQKNDMEMMAGKCEKTAKRGSKNQKKLLILLRPNETAKLRRRRFANNWELAKGESECWPAEVSC